MISGQKGLSTYVGLLSTADSTPLQNPITTHCKLAKRLEAVFIELNVGYSSVLAYWACHGENARIKINDDAKQQCYVIAVLVLILYHELNAVGVCVVLRYFLRVTLSSAIINPVIGLSVKHYANTVIYPLLDPFTPAIHTHHIK